jgi:hypothetical protein
MVPAPLPAGNRINPRGQHRRDLWRSRHRPQKVGLTTTTFTAAELFTMVIGWRLPTLSPCVGG